MKSQKENELDVARSEFIRAFNFVTGILRMKRLSRKVALGLALMVLIGGRASIRNASISFGLNYANLLRALEHLEEAWGKYLEALRALIVGPVVVIVDDTFDHKLYSRVESVASRYGNYFAWCSMHKGYESGVQVLTVALHDLGTGRSYMVGAFPYATRKMWESGQVSEFRTKIEMAAEMIEVLKTRFPVVRVVFDSWYWSEKLVKDNVVSELKSNRRLLRVRSAEGEDALEVEGHLHVGDLPPGSYFADLTLGDHVITVKLLILEYKDSRLNLYTTDLNMEDETIEETWKIRWEIEKLHRDVKTLGMQDSSFLKRRRLQGYLLLFVMVVNAVRDLIGSLKLRSVEELLRFVENGLGGAQGLMKMFKLR
ncbi:transposase [Metallosphaera hakonensis]|uniref:ISNCY family transposase n=1 Tax=Metallosphaera hakonensis JCM 8857 = DSM 7519 TaxID=1293036 RepID=A0A2U9IWE1_9CREN|nr:transposase [Metallosphaera hakonensis]AWR99165.1 ISNCY family transposase [Metallosphaera hakonensis JCM 8857 = DSM 7519]AWS00401.1 ISNCY family transposase [Metallosphaera hakonensis JCM 8857 = DSM 7519]